MAHRINGDAKDRHMTYQLDLTTAARAEALRTAFDKVCAKNWKNPINKKVWLTKDGRLRYHVTASGYYNAVGA